MKPAPIQILLVDDDEDDFIIGRDLFSEIDPAGYAVEWASSYDDAWAAMSRHAHDVYLIDYRLGAGNGLDLMKQAQAARSQAPMILLTGEGEPEVDMEAMRAGAADFLVKGQLNARTLERSVRYALERKRSEREIQKLAAFPRRNPHPVLEFSSTGALTGHLRAWPARCAPAGTSVSASGDTPARTFGLGPRS